MKFTSSIAASSLLLLSCAPSALGQQAQASITSAASVPSATFDSTNSKTLESIGYNPAQASFYASVIKEPSVKSAYEALNGEGAIDQLDGAASDASAYNSILAAAVASLPPDLQAPATSFFDGLRALGSTTAASSGTSSPASHGSATGTLLLDTTGTPSATMAMGAGATGVAANGGGSASSVGGITTTITVSTATSNPSAAGAAVARPTGWVAVGALAVGIVGVAIGV